MTTTEDDLAAYDRLLHKEPMSVRDLDLDAHRNGAGFHENPHGTDALTVRRLSWSMGWNERALVTG